MSRRERSNETSCAIQGDHRKSKRKGNIPAIFEPLVHILNEELYSQESRALGKASSVAYTRWMLDRREKCLPGIAQYGEDIND